MRRAGHKETSLEGGQLTASCKFLRLRWLFLRLPRSSHEKHRRGPSLGPGVADSDTVPVRVGPRGKERKDREGAERQSSGYPHHRHLWVWLPKDFQCRELGQDLV